MKYLFEINNEMKELTLEELFVFVQNNKDCIVYKFIDNNKILVNNDLILNCQFICHRINTINELINIPNIFGIEVDLRDRNNNIILVHDPFKDGEDFNEFMKFFNHAFIILNVKSAGIEDKCIEILNKYNITNYFFLDSSIPITYEKGLMYNFASRFSTLEPIELSYSLDKYIKWLWIDCFNIKYPDDYYKYDFKKTCMVSPELQKKDINTDVIINYRNNFIKNKFIPNAICCKIYNIIKWI